MDRKDRLKKIMSHPNSLTLSRVASVPLIVILLLFPNPVCSFLAALLFSAGAVTDFLDGYYARTRGQVSSLGKILDPIADKLMVSTSLIMLTSLGWIPAWVVCVIIGREFAVTGLRNIIAGRNADVSASLLGKYKTGFQIAAIIPLLIHYSYWGIDFNAIGWVFMWGALAMSIWSGCDYFIRYWGLFNE